MAYTYVNPVEQGYSVAHIPKKEARKLLPHRKQNWYVRTTFYISEKDVLMHHYTTILGKITEILLFPVAGLMYGFNSETIDDYKRIIFQKKYGSFTADQCYKIHTPEFYNRVANFCLVNGMPYGYRPKGSARG